MKRRTEILLVLTIALCTGLGIQSAQAQDYNAAIGIRGGLPLGVTGKYFVTNDEAIEGMLAFRYGGFTVTGLYEWHFPLAFANNLNWFVGGGAHFGFARNYKYPFYSDKVGQPYADNTTLIGLDGIIGMEYTFDDIPINVGVDWKPAIHIAGARFGGDEVAISLRYTLR